MSDSRGPSEEGEVAETESGQAHPTHTHSHTHTHTLTHTHTFSVLKAILTAILLQLLQLHVKAGAAETSLKHVSILPRLLHTLSKLSLSLTLSLSLLLSEWARASLSLSLSL